MREFVSGLIPIKSFVSDKVIMYVVNIALWYDGTLRPGRGHNGTCRWGFDGQVWYHKGDKKLLTNSNNQSTMKSNRGSNPLGKER